MPPLRISRSLPVVAVVASGTSKTTPPAWTHPVMSGRTVSWRLSGRENVPPRELQFATLARLIGTNLVPAGLAALRAAVGDGGEPSGRPSRIGFSSAGQP